MVSSLVVSVPIVTVLSFLTPTSTFPTERAGDWEARRGGDGRDGEMGRWSDGEME